jgi:hypothetical protein
MLPLGGFGLLLLLTLTLQVVFFTKDGMLKTSYPIKGPLKWNWNKVEVVNHMKPTQGKKTLNIF